MSPLAWIAAGCSGPASTPAEPTTPPVPAPAPVPTPVPTPAPTTPPPPGPLQASCSIAPTNALRAVCTVTVDPPQAVQVTYVDAAGGLAPRVAASDAPLATHTLTLYAMPPDTPYVFTAEAPGDPSLGTATGVFTTGIPPFDAVVSLDSDGPSSAPYIGFATPCSGLAYVEVVDGVTGELVWYEGFGGLPEAGITAASFTEEGTALLVAGTSILEVATDGTLVRELRLGVELEQAPHHDVFRKDGLTYVLFHENVDVDGDTWLTDGFSVFDAANVHLGEWHLADEPLLAPHGPQLGEDAYDWSHANAIWTDGGGTVLLSLRHLDTIVAIDAVPGPTFGQLQWRLAGPAGVVGTDFALSSEVGGPADFRYQHNVHALPDGTLTMLDNRRPEDGRPSRVIDLTLDEIGRTATIVAAYDLPEYCPFEGGAWRTPTGEPLATCGPSRTGYAFDPGTGDLVWEGALACGTGGSYVARLVPLAAW